MPVIRDDVDEEFQNGQVVRSAPVRRDITAEAVRYDLHDKLRRYLTTPAKNVADLDRKMNALIRLVVALDGAPDLLDDNDGT